MKEKVACAHRIGFLGQGRRMMERKISGWRIWHHNFTPRLRVSETVDIGGGIQSQTAGDSDR